MRAWEPEEDNTILRLLAEMGPKWSRIVQQLPGRSVSSVRNRWQRIEKGRKLREAGHESKNRCQRCGHPKRGHVCTAKLKMRTELAPGLLGGSIVSAALGGPPLPAEVIPNEIELPLVRRASSDMTQFPAAAIAAACASPSATLAVTGMLSPSRSVSYGAAELPGGYGGMHFGLSPTSRDADEPVPILGRMRSEHRICSELGFEALAAAATLQLAAQAEAATSIPVPVNISKQMSATPAVPPLAAMPSLMHMSSFETFANAEKLPCDGTAITSDSAAFSVSQSDVSPPAVSVSSTEDTTAAPEDVRLSIVKVAASEDDEANSVRTRQVGVEPHAQVSSSASCEG